MSTEPLFWYRPRSDGGYEGPLHSGQIEDVRKASGAWVPLFAGAAPASAEPVALPQCPFPCGWSGLHKIAVQDAAYLAKVQWPEDEEGVSVPRATAMRSMDYLIQVCRTMLNAAPVAAQAQQYVSGGSLADRLDALADTAPPGSQMQSDLYAAATIWRKHLKGPAVQQPVSGAGLNRDEEIKALDEAWKNGICHAIGEYTAAKIAWLRRAERAQSQMVDMTPPATARDRWMYEQGRLAERDPRTPGTPAQQDADKEDAERYRWLRNPDAEKPHHDVISWIACRTREDLDAVIDAARKGQP